MTPSLAWDPAALPVLALTLGAAAAFAVLRYRLDAPRWARLVAARPRRLPPWLDPQGAGVLLRRVTGGAFLLAAMGLVEALLGRAPFATLAPADPARAALLGLAPLPLLAPLLARAARAPAVRALQPEIRAAAQPPALVAASALAWAVYLLGYEHLFRGPLLLVWAESFGAWPALAVTSALYALAHLDKPLLGETLLSLPLGIALGAAALATGGVLAPFLLHLGIALAGEIGAGRGHPDIAYGRAPLR